MRNNGKEGLSPKQAASENVALPLANRPRSELPREEGMNSIDDPTAQALEMSHNGATSTPRRSEIRELGSNKLLSGRLYGWLHRNLIAPLVFSRHPPWFDARAVALGLVVGLAVPIGGHFAALLLLRFAIRFNFVLAFGVSAVNNPVSVIPLYYGYYCLGSVMVGKPVVLDMDVFEKLMMPVVNHEHWREAMGAFLALGGEILERWAIAAFMLSVIFGLAGYVITARIQKARCIKAARRLGLEYEEFVGSLESNSEVEAEHGLGK